METASEKTIHSRRLAVFVSKRIDGRGHRPAKYDDLRWAKRAARIAFDILSVPGGTHRQVADALGIDIGTWIDWRAKDPAGNAALTLIHESLERAEDARTQAVESALFALATGRATSSKVRQTWIGPDGKKMVEEVAQLAPNVLACMMYLSNRVPDRWRASSARVDVSGTISHETPLELPLPPIRQAYGALPALDATATLALPDPGEMDSLGIIVGGDVGADDC